MRQKRVIKQIYNDTKKSIFFWVFHCWHSRSNYEAISKSKLYQISVGNLGRFYWFYHKYKSSQKLIDLLTLELQRSLFPPPNYIREICFHTLHLGTNDLIDLPDSKVHGANMGPTWVLLAPDGPHIGPMLPIRACLKGHMSTVGELRSGVTGFATIYATGSLRFMPLVRNDERDEFNPRQKKGWIWPIIVSCMLSFLL